MKDKGLNILNALLLTAVLSLSLPAVAQLKSFSFPQVDSLQQKEKRHLVVFIHTDWCMYCQRMKHTTFHDKRIIALLNEKFWFAELNAEEEQTIVFNGTVYLYKPTGGNTGVQELARQLGTIEGKLSYPAICLLNAEYEIIFQYQQYLSVNDFLKVLNLALDNH